MQCKIKKESNIQRKMKLTRKLGKNFQSKQLKNIDKNYFTFL